MTDYPKDEEWLYHSGRPPTNIRWQMLLTDGITEKWYEVKGWYISYNEGLNSHLVEGVNWETKNKFYIDDDQITWEADDARKQNMYGGRIFEQNDSSHHRQPINRWSASVDCTRSGV